MRARARPLFLRTVSQILLRISQSNGKNENPKTDISALKSVFGFRVRLEIRNPDFENLNPDFPIERTLKAIFIRVQGGTSESLILCPCLNICCFLRVYGRLRVVPASLMTNNGRTKAQLACVSVRFRSKERGTRVYLKTRAKNGASKRAGRGWGGKEGNACRQTPSLPRRHS